MGRTLIESICLKCEKPYLRRPHISYTGEYAGKFCSRKCGSQYVNKKMDRSGTRHGKLVIIKPLESKTLRDGRSRDVWLCICDCGNFCSANVVSMATGYKRSCGCLQVEAAKENVKRATNAQTKHGESVNITPLYQRYRNIRTRLRSDCPRQKPYYKDKGIEMCPEWDTDYLAFKEWALKSGYKPELTIGRIDNSKGYSPENCRWETPKEQARNTKTNLLLEMNGVTKTLAEWVELNPQINKHTLRGRIKSGMSLLEALTKPTKSSMQKPTLNEIP